MVKLLSLIIIAVLMVSPVVYAGVRDALLAPFTATAKFINKVAQGTNRTVTKTVSTLNDAASGLATDTNEFGKDIFTGVTGEVIDEVIDGE